MKDRVLNVVRLVAMPVLLYIFFLIVADGFGFHNITMILSQSMIPMVMALGMYIMMDAGLMDFSMGARVIFGGTVGGLMAQSMGVFGLIIGSFLGAMAASLVMALVYRVFKIPLIVVSLGILLIFEVAGAKLAGSSGYVRVSADVYGIGSYPINIIIVAVVAVLSYFLYYRTSIGKHITVVGNDEKLCKNLGINADNVKFIAILLTGLFCGLAGILNICYSGAITTQDGMATMSMVFRPIMCVILGFTLRKYLDCMPFLIFIGAISITIIFNGFIALGFSDAVQNIVLGLFLIVLLGFGQLKDLFMQAKAMLTTSRQT